MSSSAKIDNRKKDILILGKGPTQELEHILSAEKINSINFTKNNSKRYFGKSHFEENGTQNYLAFQPMHRYFKRVVGVGTGNYINFWKSKGLSDENITVPATNDYSLNPQLSYPGNKTRVEFKTNCLKQDKITYNH